MVVVCEQVFPEAVLEEEEENISEEYKPTDQKRAILLERVLGVQTAAREIIKEKYTPKHPQIYTFDNVRIQIRKI